MNKEILEKIEKWDILKDTEGLINLIREFWKYEEDFRFKKRGKRFKLELHALGLSENEEIIDALSKNIFWMVYWMKSERGGHYYFEGELFKVGEVCKKKSA